VNSSAATLSGSVLDATGRPVAGARVHIVTAPGPVPDVAALTGADGCCVLGAVRAGRDQVACSTEAQGAASASIEVGTRGAQVELRLGTR